ncbi:MAG: DUF1207 domain-containing protein [Nitrospirae bacterium]|nr:DUF1207 domain-containing protein [Nitrospirota bacterium]
MAKTKRPLREKPVPAVGPLPVFRLLWAVQRTRGRIACRSLLVLLMLSGVPVVSTGATDIFNPTLDSRNTSSVTPDDTWNMTFLPAQDPFTPLLADPRQPTTAINALAQTNRPFIQFNGTFGADVGVVRWASGSAGIDESVQVGIMGAAFSRFSVIRSSTYLEDADYVIGLPVTFRYKSFSGRIFFYHESSHTGYNYTTLMNVSKASDFGNEILQVIPSWDMTSWLRIYGGAAYRVFGFYDYPTAEDATILIGGLEAYGPEMHALSARGYLAFNIESRGINGYVPDEDLQIGLLFHRPGTDLQIRPALDFYNGYSPMGDLIFEKEHYASLGVYFDF